MKTEDSNLSDSSSSEWNSLARYYLPEAFPAHRSPLTDPSSGSDTDAHNVVSSHTDDADDAKLNIVEKKQGGENPTKPRKREKMSLGAFVGALLSRARTVLPYGLPEPVVLIRPKGLALLSRQKKRNKKARYEKELKEDEADDVLSASGLVFSKWQRFRFGCRRVVEHRIFNVVIVALIMLNTIALAVLPPPGVLERDREDAEDKDEEYELPAWIAALFVFDYCVLAAFTVEAALKLCAWGFWRNVDDGSPGYFRSWWNITDFVVVIIGFIGVSPDVGSIAAVRAFRILRVFSTVSHISGLRISVNSLFTSMRELKNVIALTGFFLAFFSLIGLQLFAGALRQRCTTEEYADAWNEGKEDTFVAPLPFSDDAFSICTLADDRSDWGKCWDPIPGLQNTSFAEYNESWTFCAQVGDNPNRGFTGFDNIAQAMLTTFQLITLDEWETPYRYVRQATREWSALYFLLIVWFGSLFVLVLIIAVVAESYEQAVAKARVQRATTSGLIVEVGLSVGLGVGLGVDLSASRVIEESQVSHSVAQDMLPGLGAGVTIATRDKSRFKKFGQESGDTDKRTLVERMMDAAGSSRTTTAKIVPEFLSGFDPWSRARRGCYWLVTQRPAGMSSIFTAQERTTYFERVILAVIVLNVIVLAVRFPAMPDWLRIFTDVANVIFSFVFLIEFVIRLMALGFRDYFSDKMNWLDLVVALIGVADAIAFFVQGGDGTTLGLSVFMTFRLLRLFKLLRQWKSLRLIANALISSAQMYGNVAIILAVITVMFAVLGMQLFGGRYEGLEEVPRTNFDDFGAAMLAVFRIIIGEWIEPAYDAMEATNEAAVLYFLAVLLLGNFLVLNLFLALLLNTFGEIREQKEQQRKERKALRHALVAQASREGRTLQAPDLVTAVTKNASNGTTEGWLTKEGGSVKSWKLRYFFLQVYRDTGSLCYYTDSSRKVLKGAIDLATVSELAVCEYKARKNHLELVAIDGDTGKKRHYHFAANSRVDIKDWHLAVRTARRDMSRAMSKIENGRRDDLTDDAKRGSVDSDSDEIELRVTGGRNIDDDDSDSGPEFEWSSVSSSSTTEYYHSSDSASSSVTISSGSEGSDNDCDSHESSCSHALDEEEQPRRRMELAKKRELVLDGKSLLLFPPDNRARVWLCRVLQTRAVELSILAVVILSTIALAVEDPQAEPGSAMAIYAQVSDIFFTSIFVLEVSVKVFTLGFIGWGNKHTYLRDPWNVLDFAVTALGVVGLVASLVGGGAALNRGFTTVRVFRALRAFRAVRVIRFGGGMRRVVDALLYSFPPIANVLVVAGLLWLLFGILGVALFGGKFSRCVLTESGLRFGLVTEEDLNDLVEDKDDCSTFGDLEFPSQSVVRANATAAGVAFPVADWLPAVATFDNLPASFFALLQLATLEGWKTVMYDGMDAVGIDKQPERNANQWAALYFVAFIFLGSFVVLNLFIGVIVDAFSELTKRMKGYVLLSPAQRNWVLAHRHILRHSPEPEPTKPQGTGWWVGVRLRCYTIWSWKYFDYVSLGVLVSNLIVMAMWHWQIEKNPPFYYTVEGLNAMFAALYSCEVALKLAAIYPREYFSYKWNWLDLVVTIIADIDAVVFLVATAASADENEAVRAIGSVIRLLRLLRFIRLTKRFAGIKRLLFTLVVSAPSLFNILVILSVFEFVFAIAGMQLFGRLKFGEHFNESANFNTFGNSLLVLLRLSTAAGWNDMASDMMTVREPCGDDESPEYCDPSSADYLGPNCECPVPFVSAVYLSALLLIVFQLILNLYTAVVLENFDAVAREETSAVTKGTIRRFAKLWRIYDPQCTQYIALADVHEVLRAAPEPLGLGARASNLDSLRLLRRLNVRTFGGRVGYYALLSALVRDALGVSTLPRAIQRKMRWLHRQKPMIELDELEKSATASEVESDEEEAVDLPLQRRAAAVDKAADIKSNLKVATSDYSALMADFDRVHHDLAARVIQRAYRQHLREVKEKRSRNTPGSKLSQKWRSTRRRQQHSRPKKGSRGSKGKHVKDASSDSV